MGNLILTDDYSSSYLIQCAQYGSWGLSPGFKQLKFRINIMNVKLV